MLADFRKFLFRGNVVDLAVAVVVGAAFGAVVSSLVENLITPILAIPGSTDFSSLDFTISDSTFRYGAFLNSVLSFVMISTAIFFLVVKPIGIVMSRRQEEEVSTTRECPECLSEIPRAATRCAHCTAVVGAVG